MGVVAVRMVQVKAATAIVGREVRGMVAASGTMATVWAVAGRVGLRRAGKARPVAGRQDGRPPLARTAAWAVGMFWLFPATAAVAGRQATAAMVDRMASYHDM